jgi:hypothetical protein
VAALQREVEQARAGLDEARSAAEAAKDSLARLAGATGGADALRQRWAARGFGSIAMAWAEAPNGCREHMRLL